MCEVSESECQSHTLTGECPRAAFTSFKMPHITQAYYIPSLTTLIYAYLDCCEFALDDSLNGNPTLRYLPSNISKGSLNDYFYRECTLFFFFLLC